MASAVSTQLKITVCDGAPSGGEPDDWCREKWLHHGRLPPAIRWLSLHTMNVGAYVAVFVAPARDIIARKGGRWDFCGYRGHRIERAASLFDACSRLKRGMGFLKSLHSDFHIFTVLNFLSFNIS